MDAKKQAEILEQKIYDETTNFIRKINKLYKEKVVPIEKEISYFINKYATEEGLTYAEASKNLTRTEKTNYKEEINKLTKEYKKTGSKKLLAKIKELEARSVITRLDAIKNQIELQINLLAEEVINEMRYHLENVYKESVTTTDEDLASLLGVAGKISVISVATVNTVLGLPLSGMTFVERIWKCTDKLSSTLIETLQSGLVQNKKVQEITKDIKEKLTKNNNYSNYDLERVTRTETQLTFEKGKLDTYDEYEIQEFMIITARDERTCRKCAVHDSKVLPMDEFIPRVTAPPFHPQCRCYTVAVLET